MLSNPGHSYTHRHEPRLQKQEAGGASPCLRAVMSSRSLAFGMGRAVPGPCAYAKGGDDEGKSC